jgi:hypothetical protein
MAREKSVKAQTPQDAQKDTLAATEVIHEPMLVETLSDRGCRRARLPASLASLT